MSPSTDALRAHLAVVSDLNAAAAVLEWDQETHMPPAAVEARAHQLATLRRLAHEHATDDRLGALIERAEAAGGDDEDAALVRVARRDFERERKLSSAWVTAFAEATSRGREAWKTARENDHFPTFAPHLERLLDLNREKAEAMGYDDDPYDALLDEYEPGATTAEVASVFASLRAELVPLVQAVAERPAPDTSCLHRHFDVDAQWGFGLEVIQALGYDLRRGRQDRSAHPFSTTFDVTDARITTRLDERFLPMGLFGTMHEAGHAMYEQGIDPAFSRTPLASGTSLGIHESQSRLWENLVGRSRAFWRYYYPALQAHFPDALGGVELDAFYRAVNAVSPSLIRVEADELTYNLHVMLRFEIEREMLSGATPVAALPERWNDGMEAYLGLRPGSDAEGVLQDIHWSLGTIGYFPTYSLGNLMSAQFFAAAREAMPSLDDDLARGAFDGLLGWLQANVYRHGRARTAAEILEGATGGGLDAGPWLAYARDKYGALYGLD